MRIEVLVDNEEPQVFPLNKSKVIIGSHESCDVILKVGGVSRKHLIVSSQDDNIFVTDQGSTNGSYINEERLVPGRKVEFTSFFPVRLGENVLITLLSEEDASDLGFTEDQLKNIPTSPKMDVSDLNEATRTISLKDLQSAKTETLVRKRQESVVKRKAKAKEKSAAPQVKNKVKDKDKNRMRVVMVLSLGIVALAAYYNLYMMAPEAPVAPPPVAQVAQELPPKVVEPVFPLINKEDLISKERLYEIQKNPGCLSDLESYMCQHFSGQKMTAVQTGTAVNLYFDGGESLALAREVIPKPNVKLGTPVTPKEAQEYQNEVKFATMLFFLASTIPKNLDYERLKGVRITFVLWLPMQEDRGDVLAAAFMPESLEQFVKKIRPKYVETVRKNGTDSMLYLLDYFRYY